MNRAVLLAVAGLVALGARAGAVEARHRTDSGQFTVYCEDTNARQQVTSAAMRTKAQLLELLGASDLWKRPIVVTIESASSPSQPLASLRLVDSAVGMKIEITVLLRTEAWEVNLQRYFVRALLLEMMYRRTGVPAGEAYAEPPWWIVDGALAMFRREERVGDGALFRKLVETNKLPPLESFLSEKSPISTPAVEALDAALALGLLQALIDQPGGRDGLAALVRAWPQAGGDSIAALRRAFPAFADGSSAIHKWWLLALARLGATDRRQGLSAEDTDRQIAALLEFEVQVDKTGKTRRFGIKDYAEYLKLPGSRPVLAAQHTAIVALSVRANALLRPVITEYEAALALLARGKSGGLRERFDRAERLRAAVMHRAEEIADYLNWFEATQLKGYSNEFDSYLKVANELSEQEKRRDDPIKNYMDEFEKHLQPREE